MRFITYKNLEPETGISAHRTTLWRWEKQGRFPKRTKLGATFGWPEVVLKTYVIARSAGHDEREATKIAEKARPSV
jgi:predicted DNA-binding transcriptional regulator AlpA